MKYNKADFVVYHTKDGNEVFTWIMKVLDAERQYLLDFEDLLAEEAELTGYDAPNFFVPNHNGNNTIYNYHRDTMIDRIITAFNFSTPFADTTVSKNQSAIVLHTVINDPELLKDKTSIEPLKEKYNRIVATIQQRFKGEWDIEIPVKLRFPLQTIELDPIRI